MARHSQLSLWNIPLKICPLDLRVLSRIQESQPEINPITSPPRHSHVAHNLFHAASFSPNTFNRKFRRKTTRWAKNSLRFFREGNPTPRLQAHSAENPAGSQIPGVNPLPWRNFSYSLLFAIVKD
jgi:hypothetical protein